MLERKKKGTTTRRTGQTRRTVVKKGEESLMRSDRLDAETSGAQLEGTGTPVTRTSKRRGSPLMGWPCGISADYYILDLELDLAL